jgi:hypothetical protein
MEGEMNVCMNVVLQDRPTRCPGSKNARASIGSEPISSGSLPRIRMKEKNAWQYLKNGEKASMNE